ncbi:MAG: multidrug ABC transporter ATP-binding protein [Spirochaetae bacterium HGW-Spirochaetae-3]|jgi:ATP-binding cassette subfamily B protein|nr:MAG: multidrug ABC transporter ATP-binding protein [Spirochaetae bacterium HGW-Spirochaetae-3]
MLRILRYLKPYAALVAAALALEFASSMAELSLPAMMAVIVDEGVAAGDVPLIWRTGGLMLIVALAGVIANLTGGFFAARTAMGFGKSLRSKVFSRVSSFSLRELDRFGTSSLITRTTNDITQVQQVAFMMQRMMAKAPMMAIGGIAMALATEPKLAWVLLIVIPIMAAAILLIARRGLPLFKSIQTKIDSLNRVMRENLSGIRVVRAFDRVEHEKVRFDEVNADLTATTLKVNRIMAFIFPFVTLMMNLTTVMIVWFGGRDVESGAIQIGSLMAFIQYATQIMFAVVMVSVIFIMVPRAQASAERINEVLDVDPEIVDPASPVRPEAPKGRVEFRNVSFGYDGAAEPAIRNVSFVAEPGTTTAIIGGTGSGKSTILNLLARFYDVKDGAILVDGVDVRDMAQEDLRSGMGLATQRAVLFSGTIAHNLRFGRDGASDDDLARAAAIAQADGFIAGKEGGMSAELAQGGINVSGGQKQRLAIARALAREPRIYLFDDSFSALDFKTDARLRSALRKETTEATVIIVAQRVGTIRDADQIIVLDEGRIVGRGSHAELLASCGIYGEIVASQLSAEEAV